jgi:hypothetical protein
MRKIITATDRRIKADALQFGVYLGRLHGRAEPLGKLRKSIPRSSCRRERD